MAVYKINESNNLKIKSKKVTESYEDGKVSIGQLREAISSLEDLVSEMESNNISSVKSSPNTYRLGSFFLGTSSGYINLNDVYSYISDIEDEYEDEEYESLTEATDPQGYNVFSIGIDIAVPKDKKLDDYGLFASDNGKLWKALSDTLKSQGLRMAGDYIEVEDKYDDDFELSNFMNESLTEATDPQDYRVVTVSMDIAMPADKRLQDYGPIGQGNHGKLFKAFVSALRSVGLEMAGDYVDSTGDVTDFYKDNEYEFSFEESLKEDITDTPIEDVEAFIAEVKGRFPGSEVVFDGDSNTVKITLDNKEESLKENEERVAPAFSLGNIVESNDIMAGTKGTQWKIVETGEYLEGNGYKYVAQAHNDLAKKYVEDRPEEFDGSDKIEFYGFEGYPDDSRFFRVEESLKEDLFTSPSDYSDDLIDMAQVSFETGVRFDEGDFEDAEDYNKYFELMELGPAGFYEEFKDTVDFDPDFVAEYGVEESLKESESEVRNFSVEDVDGEVVDYEANSAKEAVERFKKDNPNSEILSVYDEGDIYYDIETGDELKG